MRTRIFLAVMLIVCLPILILAQESNKHKFNMHYFSAAGTATSTSSSSVDYDMNSGYLAVLLGYNIWDDFEVATGVSWSFYRGSGFNKNGSFRNERTIFAIPLFFSIEENMNKFKWTTRIGVEATKIRTDDYIFLDKTENKPFETSWGLGFRGSIELSYRLNEHYSVGIYSGAFADLTKRKAKENTSFEGKEKLKGGDFGLLLNFTF
ncbi:MAG: hypothetical protein KGV44_07675 [Flavobacteriaceae bacterium]|nr:hypothetical protein [Flavobacteriaceae bacterium]